MEKIRFITDSASDMNHPREDVTILPLASASATTNMLTKSPSVTENSTKS